MNFVPFGEPPLWLSAPTIEAASVCKCKKCELVATVLPIKTQPLESLPKTRLPKFVFPIDSPRDICREPELTSPKTARLIVTFRPPASLPRLPCGFAFVFSRNNATIVFEVMDDKCSSEIGQTAAFADFVHLSRGRDPI
ncbi:hypothetical protein TSMEX_007148 [Taenia solium]|eukprot:TsM_001203300 transcript=TsM_001203300 gene=TsM_001203300